MNKIVVDVAHQSVRWGCARAPKPLARAPTQ